MRVGSTLPGTRASAKRCQPMIFGREFAATMTTCCWRYRSPGGHARRGFSFGVLTELDRSRADQIRAKSLLDRVDFGLRVSGGAVTAAYFGLKEARGARRFPRTFPDAKCRGGLNTRFRWAISAALSAAASTTASSPIGSIETCSMAHGLTRSAEAGPAGSGSTRPTSNNRTPLRFWQDAFDALCSDIRSYRVAEGSRASAAVPLAFAPIVLETFPAAARQCQPGSNARARSNAQPLLRSFAEATARYQMVQCAMMSLADGASSTITACRFQHRDAGGTAPSEPMTSGKP